MRTLIKGIFVLIILLIVVAVMLPFIIPVDTYKKEIVAQVKAATGRDLVIAGDMKATLFPVLGIQLDQVSLSNPEGYTSKYMLQVGSLTLDVDVAALLKKELQVKQFLLAKPVINLETNAAGKPNWEFTASAKAPASAKQAAKTDNDAASAVLGGVMLGDVKISDGEIYYRDGKTKQAVSLTALNLNASLPGLSKPLNIDGSAQWNGQKVSLNAVLANPADFVAG
jgi:AsmA protein